MKKEYSLREGDKTLKQFFDRFYCVPKDLEFTNEERAFLERVKKVPANKDVALGKNGYIVFRRGKKFDDDEVKTIKNDVGTYRQKAEKYNTSIGTISKIMNDKY
ncbi:MAG: hypothetical protein KH073_20060 [Clostridium sp.]|uniref:hypothetical protein n=1 Tax=Clostridium sp. TaxID=1506 RepID=UPI0025795FE5|nr:hypothetical protein [Clostridium sp.]MBS4843126.1 hypothetical protein [Clostridium sp.]